MPTSCPDRHDNSKYIDRKFHKKYFTKISKVGKHTLNVHKSTHPHYKFASKQPLK